MKKSPKKPKSRPRFKNPGFDAGDPAKNEVVASFGAEHVENEGYTLAHQWLIDWERNSRLRLTADTAAEDRDPRKAQALASFYRDIGEKVMRQIQAKDRGFFDGIAAFLDSNVRSDGSVWPMFPLAKGLMAYRREVFVGILRSLKAAKPEADDSELIPEAAASVVISVTRAEEWLYLNGFGEHRHKAVGECLDYLGFARDTKRGPKRRR